VIRHCSWKWIPSVLSEYNLSQIFTFIPSKSFQRICDQLLDGSCAKGLREINLYSGGLPFSRSSSWINGVRGTHFNFPDRRRRLVYSWGWGSSSGFSSIFWVEVSIANPSRKMQSEVWSFRPNARMKTIKYLIKSILASAAGNCAEFRWFAAYQTARVSGIISIRNLTWNCLRFPKRYLLHIPAVLALDQNLNWWDRRVPEARA